MLSLWISQDTDPYRNLAVEEYLTFHAGEGERILYLWQNSHTVVIGRNQNSFQECNVTLLKEEGGRLVRRLSGGGAVYHDLGNLNFTFCMKKKEADLDRQTEVILQAVRLAGIQGEKTGRNDLTAGGRKFSGHAFFSSKGFYYHHGTLMIDVDREKMSRYLSVSRAKLASKGVDSVKSRVVNLKEQNPAVTVESMKDCLAQAFGWVYGEEVRPFEKSRFDSEEIRANIQRFSSWDWIYGRKIPFTSRIERRFSFGSLELALSVEEGRIRDGALYSDAMDYSLTEGAIESLIDLPYDAEVIGESLYQWFLGKEETRERADEIRKWIREEL